MKAMVLAGHASVEERPLLWKEAPQPKPGPGQLLVQVEACGVCRTDLHLVEGDLPPVPLPVIPGHQIVGHVAARGEECRTFQVGDRCGVGWLRGSCGTCRYCREGKENLCEQACFTGYHVNGGYAEYALVDEAFAYALPFSWNSQETAPLLCAGFIGYHAYRKASTPSGGKLALFGFGSSANLVLQVALYEGLEVFVATRDGKRQQRARDLGASWAGPPSAPLPSMVDSAILFAPAGELVPLALRSVRRGGIVALAEICMSDVPAMDYSSCLFHEKTLCSVEANTRQEAQQFLHLAEAIPLKTEVQLFPLSQANEALLLLKRGTLTGSAVLFLQ